MGLIFIIDTSAYGAHGQSLATNTKRICSHRARITSTDYPSNSNTIKGSSMATHSIQYSQGGFKNRDIGMCIYCPLVFPIYIS